MRRFLYITALLLLAAPMFAQQKVQLKAEPVPEPPDTLFFSLPDSISNEYLDTVKVRKKFIINDYSMIGVHYGVTLLGTSFNPVWDTAFGFKPNTFGITYTRYGKMFGFIPYFGFQIGAFHTYEGYKFKYDKEKEYTRTLMGATQAVMEVLEIPFLAQMHFDFNRAKILANVGVYAAYRWKIRRTVAEDWMNYSFDVTDAYKPATPEAGTHDFLASNYLNKFYPFEYRFDYGLKGGLGFGLVFDPIEIHFTGQVQWSWQSLYKADWYSPYYYRYAYPFNVEIAVSVHYQLTKRSGRTRADLRHTAKRVVYGDE